jgi:hypothetical protein
VTDALGPKAVKAFVADIGGSENGHSSITWWKTGLYENRL